MNLIEKALSVVANLASESTSALVFYEPKMPKELVKPKKEKQQKQWVRRKCSDI